MLLGRRRVEGMCADNHERIVHEKGERERNP